MKLARGAGNAFRTPSLEALGVGEGERGLGDEMDRYE